MQTQIAPTPIPEPPSPPKRKLPTLSGVPAPLRGLIRPMLYASIGFHALLLFVPFGAHDGDKPKLPKDQAVKVTQLPPTSKSTAKKQNIKSVPVPKTPLPIRPLARTSTSTIPAETKKAPPPDLTQPDQKDAENKLETPNKGLEQNNNSSVNDPFADFPRYPNATPGSGGSLSSGFDKAALQTADDASAVISFYTTKGAEKGFDVKPSSDQGGLKVFTVSKAGGAPQYLHILAGGKGTVILLAPQEIPASALKNAKVETESPEGRELDTLLADGLSASVSLNTVDPSVSAPVSALDGFKAEIGDAFTPQSAPIAPDAFASMLNGLLSNAGFSVSSAGSAGGGTLYEVKKNSYTGYIILVPTPAGSTAAFTFTKRPE
jgi:hypothetical protein